jgi:hypothetical protein
LFYLFYFFFTSTLSDNDGNSIKSQATYCNILCGADPVPLNDGSNKANKRGRKDKCKLRKKNNNGNNEKTDDNNENENNHNSNDIEENEEKDNDHDHIELPNSRSVSPLHSKNSDEVTL